MRTPRKPYDKLNAAELREATREYERELPVGADGLPGRPLNTAEQKQWQAVRKKMGRPRLGKGVKRVMVSLEAELLEQSDRFARKHKLSRSRMISAGLRMLMAG